jgi:hypothetical protein
LVENRFFRNSIFVGYFKVLCYVFSWKVLDRIVPHKHAETRQRVEEHN